MNEDRLDNVKLYCMLIAIFILIGEIILGADIYQEYIHDGVVPQPLFMVWLVLLLVDLLLLGVYCVLRAYLKRRQGDSYIGDSRLLRTVWQALFPKRRDGMEGMAARPEIKDSVLWQRMCSGIHPQYLSRCLLCFTAGSLFAGVGIYLWRWETENQILALVLGFLLGAICYFWAAVNVRAIRKRNGNLLQYAKRNGVSFSELNQDFLSAGYMGDQIWIGKKYLFIYINKGAWVMPLDAIIFCRVHWMGSNRHLPYFLLEIKGAGETVMKYSATPFVFRKVKKRLGVGEQS